MKTLSLREVQNNFGAVVNLVIGGESVRVTQYGRAAFVTLPERAETDELLRRIAGEKLLHLLQEATPNAAAQALSQISLSMRIWQRVSNVGSRQFNASLLFPRPSNARLNQPNQANESPRQTNATDRPYMDVCPPHQFPRYL